MYFSDPDPDPDAAQGARSRWAAVIASKLIAEPLAEFEILRARNFLTGVGGFTARPREAEIGVRVAGPEGPACVGEKSLAEMPHPSNPEEISG